MTLRHSTAACALAGLALVAAAPARAQYAPDAPPFLRADPNMGRPFDQFPSGPYSDPSLSRQGPLATPHPMFRDPARDVIANPQPPPPAVGQGLLPLASRPAPRSGLGAGVLGQSEPLTRRQSAAERGGAPVVIATLPDVARALGRCWRPPASAAPIEATVRLAFTRDGHVFGAPRVTYIKVREPELREAVRATILAAAGACAPLRFTPAAASAIAGRIFAIRLIAFPQGRQQDL
jgi:hypothetical protein